MNFILQLTATSLYSKEDINPLNGRDFNWIHMAIQPTFLISDI